MTPKEASEIIGCHKRHVVWLINSKKLKAKKVKAPVNSLGYVWDIELNSVKAFCKEQQTNGYPRGQKRL